MTHLKQLYRRRRFSVSFVLLGLALVAIAISPAFLKNDGRTTWKTTTQKIFNASL